MTDWTEVRCDNCNGHGVVAIYSMTDFDGADFCPKCGGSGQVWKSPKGKLAEFPGGRFMGSVSKK